jgi:hypothetical protein
MIDQPTSSVVAPVVETYVGGGVAASGAARWLDLVAAPTFAIMALWTDLFGSQPDMPCTVMQSSSPMNDMTLMYLLMSVFHVTAWLRLISGRRSSRSSDPAR